jgi:hypothetical protein
VQVDSDAAADCDVYVRAGSRPTQTLYDYASVTYSRQITITIPQPQFNTWCVHAALHTSQCVERSAYALTLNVLSPLRDLSGTSGSTGARGARIRCASTSPPRASRAVPRRTAPAPPKTPATAAPGGRATTAALVLPPSFSRSALARSLSLSLFTSALVHQWADRGVQPCSR